jgi:hypothetical protein
LDLKMNGEHARRTTSHTTGQKRRSGCKS